MKPAVLATLLSLYAGAALSGEPKAPNAYHILSDAVLQRLTIPKPHPAGRVDAELDIGADGYIASARLRGSEPMLTEAVRSKLTRIQLPPPPGGSFHIRHSFVFAR